MAETPGNPNMNTGGGAGIGGSVTAGDNAFIGRDQINNIYQAPEEKIGGKPRIPRPVRDFVGREAELDALCQSVENDAVNRAGAIITGLHGLGGIGKTTLALKAAERLQPRYPDGGIYLDLHGPDPNPLTTEQAFEHIIRVYHRAARLPEGLEELQIIYTQVLSDKQLLLLLDNVKDKAQVAPLLDALPDGCLALVTSRVHFAYPGMVDQHLDVLPQDQAVELLLKIAPGIGDKAAELAQACGYLPLALRTTASLLHEQVNLSPADVLAFMRDATTRLKMTKVDASLELSYQMLPEHLREPWRKLAVFAGDFDEDAAAWVLGLITEETSEEEDQQAPGKAKQTLGKLITYSLVEYKDQRYYLHDLARLFAAGKLSAEEDYAARLIHAQYYYQVLQQCNILYNHGNENLLAGLSLFDRERREITAGWDWITNNLPEETENLTTARTGHLWLCCYYLNAGYYVLSLRQHPRERIRWLEHALYAARRLNDQKAEGWHLNNLGLAYASLGEIQRAIGCYEQRLAIAREIGDRGGEGTVLYNMGNTYYLLGKVRPAIAYYEQGLAIVREIGDQRGEGNVLNNLGLAYADLGELRQAIGYYEQGLAIAHEIGDRLGEGNVLGNLGAAYAELGEVQRAIEYYEQALVIDREIGDRRGEGSDLGSLGNAYVDLVELQQAIGYYEQYLAIAREISDRRGEGTALGNLGSAYYRLSEVQQAIEYYKQQLAITREIGDRRGEANACWNLGLIREQQGDLAGAVELMQIRVDYLRELGHPDAEKVAARVDEIRARVAGGEADG